MIEHIVRKILQTAADFAARVARAPKTRRAAEERGAYLRHMQRLQLRLFEASILQTHRIGELNGVLLAPDPDQAALVVAADNLRKAAKEVAHFAETIDMAAALWPRQHKGRAI